MDRNRNRVTGPDVQGQTDMNKEKGDGREQRQEQEQSDRVRCTRTEG